MGKKHILIYAMIGIWAVVSLAALTAMYKLWWEREHSLYVGKSISEKRKVVLQRAGIPAETLEMAQRVDTTWPLDTAYQAAGSEVSLSYFKYLVLPRIPSGLSSYGIKEKNGGYTLTSTGNIAGTHLLFSTVEPTPKGLLLSAFILFTIAFGISRFGFSFPEGVACSAFLLCTVTVLTKAITNAYAPVGQTMCTLAMISAWIAWRKKNPDSDSPACVMTSLEKSINALSIFLLSASILWSMLMAISVIPDDWDAWAQWAPKAKILASSIGALTDVKYFVPGSGDYPLLWPSVWSFSGWCAGGWEEQWSKGWGVLFYALAAWQLKIFADNTIGGRWYGWFVAALFSSMPAVPLIASWGYAEAPLWLMLICAMSRLLAWRDSAERLDLFKAGIFIAAAAFTKNEGIVFAVLCMAWVASCGWKFRDIAAVGLPALLYTIAWKSYCVFGLGASNHAVASMSSVQPQLSHLVDMLATASGQILRQWSDIKQWNVVLPALLLGGTGFVLWGTGRDRQNLLLPFAMLTAVLIVVMLHGENWLWQLSVAWNRLTLQFVVLLLPVLVTGIAMRVRVKTG